LVVRPFRDPWDFLGRNDHAWDAGLSRDGGRELEVAGQTVDVLDLHAIRDLLADPRGLDLSRVHRTRRVYTALTVGRDLSVPGKEALRMQVAEANLEAGRGDFGAMGEWWEATPAWLTEL
jgi:hypothetical protein